MVHDVFEVTVLNMQSDLMSLGTDFLLGGNFLCSRVYYPLQLGVVASIQDFVVQ